MAEDDLSSHDVSELTAQLDLALENIQKNLEFPTVQITNPAH